MHLIFINRFFNNEFSAPIMRICDLPEDENGPKFSEKDKNCVMHVALPIVGGTEIMGTDMLESMGHKLVVGNNITINLLLNTREEADKLYGALSDASTENAPMREEFWGYWGTCLDKFQVRWMFNVMNEPYK